MNIGIVSLNTDEKVVKILRRIYTWHVANCPESRIDFHENLKDILPDRKESITPNNFLCSQNDVLVSIGGDGTFLYTARLCDYSKSILGINTGSLGFLADVHEKDVERSLDNIKAGASKISKRGVLDIRKPMTVSSFKAINDIYLNRKGPKLASVLLSYDGKFINEYQADGLIISTASGSTAYSLSAGGPIVQPELKVYVITPICPHSLTERPIILSGDKSLKLEIRSNMILSIDGIEKGSLSSQDYIDISYQEKELSVIQMDSLSFFDSLRSKLHWGKVLKNG